MIAASASAESFNREREIRLSESPGPSTGVLPQKPTIRVAYITKVFPRLSETFILNEIKTLEALGIEVSVFALRSVPAGELGSLPAGMPEPRILQSRSLVSLGRQVRAHFHLFFRGPQRYTSLLFDAVRRGNRRALTRFFSAVYLASELARGGYQHVHAHFATGATRVAQLARRLGGPTYSFTAHAKDIFRHTVERDRLASKIREAEFVITVSRFNRDHIESLVGPEVVRKVRVLYNGVNTEWFHPREKCSDDSLIVAIGRLVEKKGFAHLIDAMAKIRERKLPFRCVIIGNGSERANLEKRIREQFLEDRVILLGARPHTEIRDWLARAGVVCLPCVEGEDGNKDALPTVLLEAMALGIPIVSTPLTGVPEIVENGVTGQLVHSKIDVSLAKGLADALETLLLDPMLAESQGEAARARAVEMFDLRTQVARLAGYFQATCQGKESLELVRYSR